MSIPSSLPAPLPLPITPQPPAETVNSFEFTASKFGISPDVLKGKFEELQKYYASTELSTIIGVKILQEIETSNSAELLIKLGFITPDEIKPKSNDKTIFTLRIGEEIIAKSSPLVKNEDALKDVFDRAVKTLGKHPLYFGKFLVKIPPDTLANPSSVLLDFLRTYSPHMPEDPNNPNGPFKGKFGKYKIKGTETTRFSYFLLFSDKQFSTGDGTDKHEAHEEASKAFLRFLNRTVQMPKEIYFNNFRNKILEEDLLSKHFTKALIPLIQDYLSTDYNDLDPRQETGFKKEPEENKKEELTEKK
jgi:hypothetical protein